MWLFNICVISVASLTVCLMFMLLVNKLCFSFCMDADLLNKTCSGDHCVTLTESFYLRFQILIQDG